MRLLRIIGWLCHVLCWDDLFGADTLVTFEGFITLEINNRLYLLSNDTTNNSNAKTNCSRIGLELALFNNNNEYFTVSNYLQSYVINNTLISIDIWVDLLITKSFTGITCNWRNEPIDHQVWNYNEPSGTCLPNSNRTCCARMNWNNSTFQHLRDVKCKVFTFRYLCAPHYECSDGTHRCAHNCIEKIDGYDCGCNSGYLLGNDKRSCEDIDECKNNSHGCEQGCNNTDGSYSCMCQSGYQLSSNGRSCDDVNECLNNNSECKHACDNNQDSYTCLCQTNHTFNITDQRSCLDKNECDGYAPATDNSSCSDENMCHNNTAVCPQVCNNNVGSYHCSCHLGYTLHTDNISCIDVDECTETTPCQSGDVVECGMSGRRCDQTCTNTNGSYLCSCEAGYDLAEDKNTCVNIDECVQTTTPCQHKCTDTDGSFNCSCLDGYILHSDGVSCSDVNECEHTPRPCEHNCTNNIGSFFCTCREGFTLQPDGRSCEKELPNLCPCSCLSKKSHNNNTLVNVINIMTTYLINKKNLSNYRSTKKSAPDSRPSSSGIGYSCLIIVYLLVGCIVLNDASTVLMFSFSFVKKLWKKLKQRRQHNISSTKVITENVIRHMCPSTNPQTTKEN